MGQHPSNMPIPKYKEDFIVCSGCFCCAGDAACLPVPPQTPKMCGIIIPGLMCYPKFGCCITVKDMFEGEEEVLRGIDDIKEKFHACGGCCLGPLCANNAYCLMPFTCCYGEEQCLCCARDCAFPCTEKVPSTLACLLPGLMLYPEIGCCKKVGDVFADKMESGASAPAANTGGAV